MTFPISVTPLGYSPGFGDPDRFVVSTLAPQAIGDVQVANGQTAASQVWPTANKAYFCPFILTETRTYNNVVWLQGGVASGAIDIGVYDSVGNRQFSLGSTNVSGTTTSQISSVTPFTLTPGSYFL